MEEEKITRLEVIDEKSRKYVKWNCKIKLSVQDNGRTLKIFVSEGEDKPMPSWAHELDELEDEKNK